MILKKSAEMPDYKYHDTYYAPDGYQRWHLTIEYDGSYYHGWQYQDNLNTVQGICEKALYALVNEHCSVIGAGRTDAGVHALAMSAHCDIPIRKNLDYLNIIHGMNYYLQQDNAFITILNAQCYSHAFHARFSAKRRYYHYRILQRVAPSPLLRHKIWHIRQALDSDMMQQATEFLVGQHDFSSFRASQCQAKSPIKTLESLYIEKSDEEIIITAYAPSFLHHQIRNIVGCLVDIGKGKEKPEWIEYLLQIKDRNMAGATAPACGLYFIKAEYDDLC